MPATPGAPPEVFAEGQDGDAGPPSGVGGCGGLFYIRIESAAETILTDFFSLSLFSWRVVWVQMSVYPGMKPLALVQSAILFHLMQALFSYYIFFPKLNRIFFNLGNGIPSS